MCCLPCLLDSRTCSFLFLLSGQLFCSLRHTPKRNRCCLPCLLDSRTCSFLFLLGSSFALCVTHKKGIFLLRVCILDDASDLPRDILQFVLQERKERVFEKEPTEKHTSKEREREEREREKEERDPRSKILARTL